MRTSSYGKNKKPEKQKPQGVKKSVRYEMAPFYTEIETLQHTDDTWLRAKLMRLELQNQNLKAQVNKKTVSGLLLGLYSKIVKNRIERQKNQCV